MTSSSAPAERLAGWSIVLLIVALLGRATPAAAHDESVSASEVVVTGAEVRWTVDVGVAGLAKVIPFGRPVGPGERAVSEPEIQARRQVIAEYLAGGLKLTLDGLLIPAEPGAVVPRHETLPGANASAITRVAVELRFRAPRAISELQARVAFFSDLTRSHRAVLRVSWEQESRQLTASGVTELRLVKGQLQPSRLRLAGEFALWGIQHILAGLDHLAFLLALMLAIVKVRELLVVITAFTIAHSITTFLAASDLVRMPAAITEALIAASIVYVAGENLLLAGRGGGARGRWFMAFGFGLIHGLGFAEVLRDRLADVSGALLLPMLAFNLGVEVGQLAVVAAIFPALCWLRRRGPAQARLETRQKQILRLGSLPLLTLGLVWLVQRLG